eukprot:GHRQ01019643.1.p1 GENE.GHRQ01019643.1~~GHRQ01019643.1.p1  ORF type:complete len:139 (-),score=23.76 GHRQ01019643.1:94-510(-)
MLLGSNNYLLQKMSSTVVSSLMTGTPIIADAKVLNSYTFLKPETVHLMAPGETEMDVMQRVSGVQAQQQEHAIVRRGCGWAAVRYVQRCCGVVVALCLAAVAEPGLAGGLLLATFCSLLMCFSAVLNSLETCFTYPRC